MMVRRRSIRALFFIICIFFCRVVPSSPILGVEFVEFVTSFNLPFLEQACLLLDCSIHLELEFHGLCHSDTLDVFWFFSSVFGFLMSVSLIYCRLFLNRDFRLYLFIIIIIDIIVRVINTHILILRFSWNCYLWLRLRRLIFLVWSHRSLSSSNRRGLHPKLPFRDFLLTRQL